MTHNSDVEDVEESEVEVNEEDAQRLSQLKESVKKYMQCQIFNQPLNILINKSEIGHKWNESNVKNILRNCLEDLKSTLSWLSYEFSFSTMESKEKRLITTVICKVNETVYFCFSLYFAPLSRCLKGKWSSGSSSHDIKDDTLEVAYEHNKTAEEIMTRVATDYSSFEKVFVITTALAEDNCCAYQVKCENLKEIEEKMEFQLQNHVEEMHENGFTFRKSLVPANDVRIFFGTLYVLGYHVNFSEEISFYG